MVEYTQIILFECIYTITLYVGHMQIKSLLVRCGNHKDGCTWEGELRSSAKHASDKCPYREVECPECDEKVKWSNLAKHEEEECIYRSYECPECLETNEYWYITGDHVEVCPMVLSECPSPGCEVEICDALVNFHMLTDCNYTKFPCKFEEVGCTVKLLRRDMEEHEKEYKTHLELTLKSHVITEKTRRPTAASNYLQVSNWNS